MIASGVWKLEVGEDESQRGSSRVSEKSVGEGDGTVKARKFLNMRKRKRRFMLAVDAYTCRKIEEGRHNVT